MRVDGSPSVGHVRSSSALGSEKVVVIERVCALWVGCKTRPHFFPSRRRFPRFMPFPRLMAPHQIWRCTENFPLTKLSPDDIPPPRPPGGAIRTLTLFYYYFFLLWHPLSDVWWLPTNRHRLHTNRHRLHTNRHRLHPNRHRLLTNRHRLPTGCHRRAYWTLRVFFFSITAPPAPPPPL